MWNWCWRKSNNEENPHTGVLPRVINTHAAKGENSKITLEALDGPGAGNASREYMIYLEGYPCCPIAFQNAEQNGLTNEVLLAVLIDRLQGFQSGNFPCKENQEALNYIRKALSKLQERTVRRIETVN